MAAAKEGIMIAANSDQVQVNFAHFVVRRRSPVEKGELKRAHRGVT